MTYDPSAARPASLFSDNPTYQGAWLCYVHGREVPVVAWSTGSGVWKIPNLTIHVVPDVSMARLGHEDRIPVQLFVLDQWYGDKPRWRLLVDGEIIGWSFSNATGMRTMSFNVLSHIHVFNQVLFYYLTNVDDIVASRSPENLVQAFTQPGLLYPHALFHQGLLTTSGQAAAGTDFSGLDPAEQGLASTLYLSAANAELYGQAEATAQIQAPYELVYNVIKGIISTQVPTERRAIPMMNFFARHVRKTRLHQRFVRLPIFEDPEQLADRRGVFPIFNAARNNEAINAMQRQAAAQVGNSGPVWNLLKQLLDLVYMQLAMVPNPACVRVQLLPAAPGQPQEGKILGLFTEEQALMEQRSVGSDTTVRHATRVLAQRIQEAVRDHDPTLPAILETAGFANVPDNLESVALETQIYTYLSARDRQAALQETKQPDVGVNPTTPLRLAQYFVKPEFLFGVAPACNVIFPSMVEQWSFDESYINQPTRTYINDSVMTSLLRAQGANREFMLHALTVAWPEEANAVLHHKVSSSAEAGSAATPSAQESGRNLLIWPEEYFKGPVTARAAVPAWFQMMRQFTNAQAGQPDPAMPAPARPAVYGPAGDVAFTLPTPVVPGSSQPRTTQQIAGLTNTGADNGVPTAVSPAGTATSASRLLVGRRTVISLNGRPEARFWLSVGRGLDPDTFRPCAQTALWPLPPPNANASRRGRRASAAGGFTDRTEVQKRAQLLRLITPEVQRVLAPGTTPDTARVIAWGFLWLALTEGAATNMYNWGLGNQKQYDASAPRVWTVQPDRQPYVGADNAQEGARNFVNVLMQSDALRGCVNVLATGATNNPTLQAIFNSRTTEADRRYWAQFGPARPDFFYIALGFAGYYSQESDRHDGNDPTRRALIGVSRIGGIKRWFGLVQGLFARNAVPEDVVTVRPSSLAKPLVTQEDLTFLRAQAAGGAARRRTVVRPVPRIDGRTATPGTTVQQPNRVPATGASGVVSPTTVQPPGAGETVDGEEQEEHRDTFAELFALYAQYHHQKSRYEQRNVGVMMKFNPYPVVGFPMFLFDEMSTGIHVVGYLMALDHAGHAMGPSPSLSSQAQLSFCRIMPEFLNDVRMDAERYGGRVTAAPADVIPEIRTIIQDDVNSELFYQRMFYGGARPDFTPASFKWDTAMGYARGLSVEAIEIEGNSVATPEERLRSERTGEAEANTPGAAPGQTVTHNIDPNMPLSPRDNIYQDAFAKYDTAMRLAARPVVSLDDFIRFWHAGRTITDLQTQGEVGEERNDYGYVTEIVKNITARAENGRLESSTVTRATATYYTHIFKLRPGPGVGPDRLDPPTEDQRGYTNAPNVSPTSTTSGVPADYPQSRADWDVVIDAYVEKVRRRLSPSV